MKKSNLIILGIAIALVFIAVIASLLLQTSPLLEPSTEVCDGIDNDGDGLVDEGLVSTCNQDSDCGPTGEFGERFCRDGSIMANIYESSCGGEPGTCSSKCTSRQTTRIIEQCSGECSRGACI